MPIRSTVCHADGRWSDSACFGSDSSPRGRHLAGESGSGSQHSTGYNRGMTRRHFRRLLGSALLLVVAESWTTSAAVRPPKLQYDISTLPNGLTLILSEDHSTPIVHMQVWYHVGSKNEKKGRTGFAHLFEHLMFKGSKNVEPEEYTSLIAGLG